MSALTLALACSFRLDAVVLLVGADRLKEKRKGHDHVAAALQRLVRDPRIVERVASGQIVCAAFGEGDLDDPGIPVVRLGRLSGDEQTALAYRAADLFLLPTLEDNLPNTLLEAIAAGTPVVSYATGGVPDLLRDGECGRLVPRGDVDRLASAIVSLIADADVRKRMSAACLSLASERLELAIQARAYLALYEQILRRKAGTRVDAQPAADRRRYDDTIAATESTLLAGLTSVPQLSSRLLVRLAEQGQSHQELIASRGGEIVALNAALSDKEDALQQAGRELRQLEQALLALSAERAALRRRLTQVMKRVVIFGSGDAARRAWEALVRSGGAEVAGFVDSDERRQGRQFLGLIVHSPEWLKQAMWDVVVVATSHADEASRYLAAAGITASRIMVCAADESSLEKSIAARFPDSLARLMTLAPSSRPGTRVGIFGTGAGAMRVWEALAEIDAAEVTWFADNNPAQQGRALLWLDVIAPAQIATREYDVVVIGSMSRDPIRKQLLQLGVAPERILAPDVVNSTEHVRDQLATMIAGAASEVVR